MMKKTLSIIALLLACLSVLLSASLTLPTSLVVPTAPTKVTVDFTPLSSLFTNFVTVTTTNRSTTNGSYYYFTNVTTTVAEIIPVKPITNYLVTLTPGTNLNVAFSNTASPLFAITNLPPVVLVSSNILKTNYVVSAWALLADGQKLHVGFGAWPSAPTNVLTLKTWLVSKTNFAASDWKRVLTLGEVSITNPSGAASFFYASEVEEAMTDLTPKMVKINRNVFTQ